MNTTGRLQVINIITSEAGPHHGLQTFGNLQRDG